MDTKQQQTNTFTGGLNMDLNPITTPNNILTDCINGTIITQDGNEYLLQNDFGNVKVDGSQLTPGYVPVGMKEYNGIIYIVSHNPINNKTEVGSFPSIEFKGDSNSQNINCDINISDISGNSLKYSEALNIYKEGIYIDNNTGKELIVEAGSFINIQLDYKNIPDYITINNFIKTDSGNSWAIANDSAKMIEYGGTVCYNFSILNSSTPTISNFLPIVKYNPDWSKKINIQTRSSQESNAIVDLSIATSVDYNTNTNLANFIENYKIKLNIYTVKENVETLINSSIIDNFTLTTKTFNSQINTYTIEFPVDENNTPDFIRVKLEPYLEFEDHVFIFDQSIGIYDYNILIEDRTDNVYAFDKYQYYLENDNWMIEFNTGYNPDIIKDITYKYDILTGTIEDSIAKTVSIYKNNDEETLKNIDSTDINKTITIPKSDLIDENIYILQLQISYSEKIDNSSETEGTEETEQWETKTSNLYRFLITANYFKDKAHTVEYIDYSSIPLNVWAQKSDLININLPSEIENIKTDIYNNVDNWLITTIRVVDPDKEVIAIDGNTYLKDKKNNFYKSVTKTGDIKIEKIVNLEAESNNIWSSNITGNIDIMLLENDNVVTNYQTTIESDEELKNSISFYYEKYYELYSNEVSEGNKYYHRKYLYDDYCGEKLYLSGNLLRKEELENNIYEKYKSSLMTDKNDVEIKKTNLYLNLKYRYDWIVDSEGGSAVVDNISMLWNQSVYGVQSFTKKCIGDFFGNTWEPRTINNVDTVYNCLSRQTHTDSTIYASFLLGYIIDVLNSQRLEKIEFNGQMYNKNSLSGLSTFIPVAINPKLYISQFGQQYRGLYNNDTFYTDDIKYVILVHQYSETEKIEGTDRYDLGTEFGNVKLLTINNEYLFDSLDKVNNICRNLSTTHFIYNKDKYLVSPNKFRKFQVGDYKQNIIKNYNINKINIDINLKSINLWGAASNSVNFPFDIPLSNITTSNNKYTIMLNNNKTYSIDIEEFVITQEEYDKLNNSVQNSILNTQLSTTYAPTNYRDYEEYNLVLDNNSEIIVDIKANFLDKNTSLTTVYDSFINCMAIKFKEGNSITNKVGLGVGVREQFNSTIYWNDILYLAYNTKENFNIDTSSESIYDKNYTSISYMFMTPWDKLINILTYENTSKYNFVK